MQQTEAYFYLNGEIFGLEALLGELLESERLSGRHVALDRQAVDPSALLHELIAESFPDVPLKAHLDPESNGYRSIQSEFA